MEKVLTYTRNNGIFVIDLRTGVTLSTIKGVSNCSLYGYAYFNTSSIFATSSALSTQHIAIADAGKSFVHIFRRDCADEPQLSFSVPERLPCIGFSPCGSILIGGGQSGNVYVWETFSGCLKRCWRGHYKSVTAVGISSNSMYLVTAGSDGVTYLYYLQDILDHGLPDDSPAFVRRWTAHVSPITAVAAARLGNEQFVLLTGAIDGSLHVMHPDVDGPIATFLLLEDIRHICVNSVTLDCYVACGNSKIYICELGTLLDPTTSLFFDEPQGSPKKPIAAFEGHTAPVDCLCHSSDGSLLISGGGDGLRIWDIPSRQMVQHIASLINCIAAVSIVMDPTFENITAKSYEIYTAAFSAVPDETFATDMVKHFVCSIYYTRIQEELNQLFPELKNMRMGYPSPFEMERSKLERLLQWSNDIEVHSLHAHIQELKEERRNLSQSVSDLLTTLCSLPEETVASLAVQNENETKENKNLEGGDSKNVFYTCALPVPPINPAKVLELDNNVFCQNKVIYPNGRLFQYFDRCSASSHRQPRIQLNNTNENKNSLSSTPVSWSDTSSAKSDDSLSNITSRRPEPSAALSSLVLKLNSTSKDGQEDNYELETLSESESSLPDLDKVCSSNSGSNNTEVHTINISPPQKKGHRRHWGETLRTPKRLKEIALMRPSFDNLKFPTVVADSGDKHTSTLPLSSIISKSIQCSTNNFCSPSNTSCKIVPTPVRGKIRHRRPHSRKLCRIQRIYASLLHS